MYFRVIHVSPPLSDIMRAGLRDPYTIIGINVQIVEAVHVELPTKLSERRRLRVSVGELPFKIDSCSRWSCSQRERRSERTISLS